VQLSSIRFQVRLVCTKTVALQLQPGVVHLQFACALYQRPPVLSHLPWLWAGAHQQRRRASSLTLTSDTLAAILRRIESAAEQHVRLSEQLSSAEKVPASEIVLKQRELGELQPLVDTLAQYKPAKAEVRLAPLRVHSDLSPPACLNVALPELRRRAQTECPLGRASRAAALPCRLMSCVAF
jgi:hypothetical protein